jgi:D-psicose/D-tagatose/L-ribulose 3-epimerase
MPLNVTYGVSTWLWVSPFTTRLAHELFTKIAQMGFDVVEIAVDDPALIDAKEIKKALNAHGLKTAICGAFGPTRDLTNADPGIQQNGINYIQSCLDICNELGADFLSGPMYAAVGKARMLPATERKKEWQLAVKNLQKVCRMAESRDLKLAIEPLNRFESDLVNTAEDVVRLIKDIDHPAAQIMLDSFHMGIEERNIEEAIKCAGERLLHVQVADNYRGTPGTGQTDWASYRRGLEKIKYEGIITIESFTTDNVELAGAVAFWNPKAESQDAFAEEGLHFLKKWASEKMKTSQNGKLKSLFNNGKKS